MKTGASLALAMMFAACGGDSSDVNSGGAGASSEDELRFSRTFELVDQSGESSATLTLWVADRAVLAEFREDSFELISIMAEDEEDPSGEETSQNGIVDAAGEVDISLADEVLGEGVIGLEVVEQRAPSYRAPFKKRYNYSSRDCVDVTRTAWWHRVWTSIWFQKSSGGTWHNIVNSRKLANNETYTGCHAKSYKLKVETVARRTRHYDIQFH
jgi:hypothetical protein